MLLQVWRFGRMFSLLSKSLLSYKMLLLGFKKNLCSLRMIYRFGAIFYEMSPVEGALKFQEIYYDTETV